MLKNLLVKCAQMISRDDLANFIANLNAEQEQGEEGMLFSDTQKLISCYNNAIFMLFDSFLSLSKTEKVAADAEGKLFYYYLSSEPLRILSVKKDTGEAINFSAMPFYISTHFPYKILTVKYNYCPKRADSVFDEVSLPRSFPDNLLCYLIVAEFLAVKNELQRSEFFKQKFTDSIFNFKNKRERRFKSTFCL